MGTVTYVGGAGGGTAGAAEHMSDNYLRTWGHRFASVPNYTVPCRPIGEMIRSANISHVDFFSLDGSLSRALEDGCCRELRLTRASIT